jgi:hypothetical protein
MNGKSQMSVIEALLLIGILLTAMVFFATQMDRYSSSTSNELRERTFEEIGNYIVASGIQSESAWITKDEYSSEMTIPLDTEGNGENDVFMVEEITPTKVRITAVLGETVSLDLSLGDTFYIGLENAAPTVALSGNLPDPLDTSTLAEFIFTDLEEALVEGEMQGIVHFHGEKRLAVIGKIENMTDMDGDTVPDIFEVLSEIGVDYYPIEYAVREELMEFYTCMLVPSGLEDLVENLEGTDDEYKRKIIHDFVAKGGGLVVLSQKYVNSNNPQNPYYPTDPYAYDPTSTPSLRKESYQFIPVKLLFEYGNDGVDYELLEIVDREMTGGVSGGAISGYFPTAAGYIHVPETGHEGLKILVREDEIESTGAGNTGDYPVMVAEQYGAGLVIVSTLVLDSRTVVTEPITSQVEFLRPLLITGEYRHKMRDLLDQDHDGGIDDLTVSGEEFPYEVRKEPSDGYLTFDDFAGVIIAGGIPTGVDPYYVLEWDAYYLYGDGGCILSTGGDLLNARYYSGGWRYPYSWWILDLDEYPPATGCTFSDVDPTTVTGKILYDIDENFPLQWDNLLFCNSEVMEGFDTFWTFDIMNDDLLNEDVNDQGLEEAGIISFNPSNPSTPLFEDAKKHNYIRRMNMENTAHYGIFAIGEPLEAMGGYVLEASQFAKTVPGDTVTYPFTVGNYGPGIENFSLTASSSWSHTITDEGGTEVNATGFLMPTEDDYLPTSYFNGFVKVQVPSSANGGDSATTVLTVTPEGETDPVGKAVFRTTAVDGIELTPYMQYSYLYEGGGTPPEWFQYPLTVYNDTNSSDVVDLDVPGTLPYYYNLLEVNGTPLTDSNGDPEGRPDVEVPAGGSYNFVLEITAFPTASGDSSTVVITAISSNDPNNSSSSTAVTTCIDDGVYDQTNCDIDTILAPSTSTALPSSIESSAEKLKQFYTQQLATILIDDTSLLYNAMIGLDFGGGNIFRTDCESEYVRIDQDDNGLSSTTDNKGYYLPKERGVLPNGEYTDEEKLSPGDLFQLTLYARESAVTHTYMLDNIVIDAEEVRLELINEENIKLFRNMLVYTSSHVTTLGSTTGPRILLELNRTVGEEHYRIIGAGNAIKIVAVDDASVYAEVSTRGLYVAGDVNTATSERIYLVITDYGIYIRGE